MAVRIEAQLSGAGAAAELPEQPDAALGASGGAGAAQELEAGPQAALEVEGALRLELASQAVSLGGIDNFARIDVGADSVHAEGAADVLELVAGRGMAATVSGKSIILTATGGGAGLVIEVVQQLPETGDSGTLYLVPNEGSGDNIYDEYVWLEEADTYELIGTTEADLSDYVTETELEAALSGKADDTDATTTAHGLMSAADKLKLDGIESGAQANTVTGVKGDAESSYRTGNVNLTPSDIGAAEAGDLANYLPIAGGTVTGNLGVQGATTLGSRSGISVGANSVAEGHNAAAEGHYSHAEGDGTKAGGFGSHSEGYYTEADGNYSHAQNLATIAASASQTALGKYNVEDANGTYAAIIGNGTADDSRSNALTVDWSGNVGIAGDVQDLSGNAKYLPLSGGTLTGSVTENDHSFIFKSTDSGYDRDGANPPSAIHPNGYTVVDKDGERVGFMRVNRMTDGRMQMQLTVFNEDSDGNEVSNYLLMSVAKDGTQSIGLPAKPWLAALFPSLMNTVGKFVPLLGDSRESGGYVGLPLPVNYGGTGASNAADARTNLGIGAYGSLTGQSSTLNLSTSAQKIPFSTFSGVGCSASSNGIKVAQAGTYMVWAAAYFTSGFNNDDLPHLIVYKNSTNVYDCNFRIGGTYRVQQAGPVVLALAANDVIYAYAYNQTAARGQIASRTNVGLTVKRIA